MQRDDDVLDAPRDGWQDFLQRLAHGVRRVALEHPKAFPLVASRPPEAPWLRPPLRSLDWVEASWRGCTPKGSPTTAAVAAYRAFTSFLLGHLLLEVSTHGADVGPLDVLEEDRDRDVAGAPTPVRAAARRRCPRTTPPWSSRKRSRTSSTGSPSLRTEHLECLTSTVQLEASDLHPQGVSPWLPIARRRVVFTT